MKKTLFILIILFATNAFSQNKKTAWMYDGLKSQVKTLQTKSYSVETVDGKIHKNQIIDDVYGFTLINYNLKGDWTRYRSYKPDGSNRWSENPTYNAFGNLTERGDFTYSNLDSVLHSSYSYKYDEFGNVIESVKKSPKDSMIWRRVYQYDVNGNNIELSCFDSNNKLESKKNNKYSKYSIIESETRNAENSIIEHSKFKYDSDDNLIEESVYETDLIKNTTKYQYDNNGNKLKISIYKSDGSLDKTKTYQYKYDLKNNWIERIEFIDNVAVKIKERQIEYY